MVLCPRQQEAFNNRSKKGLSDTGFRRPGHALFTCWLVFLLFYVKVLLIEGGVEFIKQKNTFRYRKKETQHPISIFFSLMRIIQAHCELAQTWAAFYYILVQCLGQEGPLLTGFAC